MPINTNLKNVKGIVSGNSYPTDIITKKTLQEMDEKKGFTDYETREIVLSENTTDALFPDELNDETLEISFSLFNNYRKCQAAIVEMSFDFIENKISIEYRRDKKQSFKVDLSKTCDVLLYGNRDMSCEKWVSFLKQNQGKLKKWKGFLLQVGSDRPVRQ